MKIKSKKQMELKLKIDLFLMEKQFEKRELTPTTFPCYNIRVGK